MLRTLGLLRLMLVLIKEFESLPRSRPESREKGNRWRGSVCERDVKENHWESTRTPLFLSLNLFLSNTPTQPRRYLIQTSQMCESPNKNRHTKHCMSSDTGSPATLCRQTLMSPLLSVAQWASEDDSSLLSGHYRGKKQGSGSESLAKRAMTQTHSYNTERVGQGQVVASSLTCCQVPQQRTKLPNPF